MSNKTPDAAQAIIDKHMEELMQELETADFQAVGVIVGVLCEGQTSVSWCAKDDMVKDSKIVPVEEIVREIAVSIEKATAK